MRPAALWLLLLQCFIIAQPPIAAKIKLFNENIQTFQESSVQCIMQIARKHFSTGSSICIVESDLKRKLNLKAATSMYRLLVEKILDDLRWTVHIKEAISL